MYDVFYTLDGHDDIAKLELEDGLVRHAAVELLSKRSFIRQIVVDVPRARSIDLGIPARPAGFDASVRITADREEDAHPDALADLVLDVANIVGTWTVANHETTELPKVWIGTATPGVKLMFLFNRAAGIDITSYDTWLQDAIASCESRLHDAGVRYFSPLTASEHGDDFDTIAEFSFVSEDALDDAIEERALSPLVGSELLDPDSVRIQATIEHRLLPNKNAWPVLDDETKTES